MMALSADSLRPPLVELPLADGAMVSFSTLSAADLEAIGARLGLAPVEFVIETLAGQAKNLPDAVAALRRLPRPSLLRLARSWAAHPNAFEARSSEMCGFSDFKRLAERRVDELRHTIRELGRQLSDFAIKVKVPKFPRVLTEELAKIESSCRSMATMIDDRTTRITKIVAESFRASLPDPKIMQQVIEGVNQGKAHLDAHGYGFAVFDMAHGGLRRIADEKPESGEIHRAFLGVTRDPEFGERLLARLAGSRRLRRREPIVRAILAAHVDRNYALSVPCLYGQVEGILTDLLVLEGLARRDGPRVRAADSQRELGGLTPKAREYGRKATVMRSFVTSSILEGLSPGRNAVLHGAKTSYRQAKGSARLLLLVDALTHIFEETEP